jgi:hypothetical protein
MYFVLCVPLVCLIFRSVLMYRWKRIESSVYNNPRVDVPEDYRRGSYVPQNEVVNALVHHDSAEAMEAGGPVETGKEQEDAERAEGGQAAQLPPLPQT